MTNYVKRIIPAASIVLLLILLGRILLFSAGAPAGDGLSVQQGLIDARNWSFASRGPLPLRGDWIFLHSVFLSPAEFSKFNNVLIKKQDYITIPGFWNWQSAQYPAETYGTFVLKIILPENIKKFGLYIGEISSAYTLYINDDLVMRNGLAGTSRQTSRASSVPRIWTAPTDTSEITLLLHVSNYQGTRGGMWSAPLIGTPSQIYARHYGEIAADLFLFGSVFMIALYHFGLFCFRRMDRQSLFFALFCFMVSLRGILTGARFFQWSFPWIGFEASSSMRFISVYAASYFYYRYHILKFPEESWRPFLTITNIIIGFVTLSALIMPIRQHMQLIFVFEVYLVCEITLILGGLFLALFRHREESLMYTAGFSILFLTVLHDILNYNMVIAGRYLFQYGAWLFILLHSFLMARHYVGMERKTLDYAASLEILTAELEDKIQKNR